MMRDVFEAGLNEAAASLAATYGRWSSARRAERGARDGRREPFGHFEEVSLRDVRKSDAFETICARAAGRDRRGRLTRGELANRRCWMARISELVERVDLVGELGVMSCHIVALVVWANGATMNRRRPCDRRNMGRCRDVCRSAARNVRDSLWV